MNEQLNIDASGSRFKLDMQESSDNFFFRVNAARTPDVTLIWATSNKGNVIQTGPTDTIRHVFQLKGRSHWRWGRDERFNHENGFGCIVPPQRKLYIRNEAHFEALSLRVAPLALRKKLSALIGEADVDPRFDYSPFENDRQMSSLRHATVRLAIELEDARRAFHAPGVIGELAQAIVVRFLLSHRHSHSDRLCGREATLAEHQVRRIEDYLAANWDKPFEIEEAVACLQMSGRTIFRALQSVRGYSPTMFIRSLRLESARFMLSSGDESTSVMSIALRCGFHSLGHFSDDYRKRYGELPSSTLRNARSKRG